MGTESDPKRLAALPATFAPTRAGLHRVAERIVAPARKPQNEISLRATEGGFGTPRFEYEGSKRMVRVEGADLVYERGADRASAGLTTLAEAGDLVSELLPPDAELDDAPLGVELDSALVLAAWYALAQGVLGTLADEAPEAHEPTIPLLWPEHFDLAIESGSEASDGRANYGFSPGDDSHPEPYAYVGPWSEQPSSPLWNATGFPGAELSYAELLGAEDPAAAALDFCRARRQALER